MLFKEINAVCEVNRTEHKNILGWRNSELCMLKNVVNIHMHTRVWKSWQV